MTDINLTDINLIEECRRGDPVRFRELVRQTSPFVYSLAYRMLGDEEDARDVVQDTMVIIWQKIGKMKSVLAYKTWVYRIVMNKCYDKLRQQKKVPEVRADDKTWSLIADTVSDNSAGQLEKDDISAIIRLLTAQLSPKQKAVFVLSDLEDMSGDEISRITGMSKTSVKSNLWFARKAISGMIEKYVK